MSEFQRNSTPTLPMEHSNKQRYNFRKHLACHKRKDFNSFSMSRSNRHSGEFRKSCVRNPEKDRVTDEIETGRSKAVASSSLESLEISGINFDCGLNSDELGYISSSGIQNLTFFTFSPSRSSLGLGPTSMYPDSPGSLFKTTCRIYHI